GNLMPAGANRPDPVYPHQSTNAALTNIKPRLFKLHCHPRSAVAAKAKIILVLDVRQHFHIHAGPLAHWARTPGTIAARRYPHYTTQHLDRPYMAPAIHKCEPHGRWLAKNCVAFFRISLSSLRMRFSRRRRSFSRAKSACGAAVRSLGRYCDTHLPSVDKPTPKSAATRRRDNPLLSAIRVQFSAMPRIACAASPSCLKSSVCFFISSVSLYECYTLKSPARNRYKSRINIVAHRVTSWCPRLACLEGEPYTCGALEA